MLIRLESIELNNFKNVQYGKIRLPSLARKAQLDEVADIVGIYGQNGSGKTAVIDTLSFLKLLMSGSPLPVNVTDYITKTAQCAIVVCVFSVEISETKYLAEYRFVLETSEESPITAERVTLYSSESGKKRRIDGIEHSKMSELFIPKKRWSAIVKKARIELEVEKRMCMREHRSVIFSPVMNDVMFYDADDVLQQVIVGLREYAEKGLYIVKSDTRVASNSTIEFIMPATSHSKSDCYGVQLTEPTTMPLDNYDRFCTMLESLNTVMNVIIPGLSVQPHEFGHEIMRDGNEGMRFELMSKRSSVLVPLRYESEGIKKIISIINLIIAMYNCYSMCIVVDEMDAGVFEFLLGELLACIEEGGKGQLIFTSHNLRPLEMISNENLIFTTTNPNNRYIHIQEKTNNLRNSYLRHIMLGGLKEDIYESVNTQEIASAFRKCRTNNSND